MISPAYAFAGEGRTESAKYPKDIIEMFGIAEYLVV